MFAEILGSLVLAYGLAYFLAGIFFGASDSYNKHTGAILVFVVTGPFVVWLLYA